MKKYVFLLLSLISFSVSAQVISPENRIVVLGEASVEAPADQVQFSITLHTRDSLSLDSVYIKHKRLENKVVRILKELNIPSNKISYTLFAVGKRPDYDRGDEKVVWYFEGTQDVSFTVDSIMTYSAIQDKLIREGVITFSSNFKSSKEQEIKKEVLTKAVEAAKAKAETLATAANRKLKRIVKVADADESDPVFRNYSRVEVADYAISAPATMEGGSLIEIPQSVSVSATVKVVFELK
ncbi:SIMPL domain-containing protein [Rufibacter roseus]|uniref:SIMPL domain-containing protein n=1 Tax=Rufibacter roseus TaxID=1567108 RepID=A0ABW2DLL7_9BACT|nr:SIMPL domain-containing protein [Rufibacter roseus]